MSMLSGAASRRLFSPSSPRTLAFGLLGIAVISLFAVMPLFAQAGAHIRGVHVTTRSQVLKNGKLVPMKTDIWYKLPDQVRNENPYMLFIGNGTTIWQYDKKRKVYSVQHLPSQHGDQAGEGTFNVDNQIAGWQAMGGKVTQKEIATVYKGQPCTAIDVTVLPTTSQKNNPPFLGPSEYVYYLLPNSRLIRAETATAHASLNGKPIITSTTSEYDYSDVRPDEFFTFTPPANAKEVDRL